MTADVLASVMALRPERVLSCGYPARACAHDRTIMSPGWLFVASEPAPERNLRVA